MELHSCAGRTANIRSVDACTTRLRLICDYFQSSVDEGALKRLGARGVVRPSAGTLLRSWLGRRRISSPATSKGPRRGAPPPAPARGTLQARAADGARAQHRAAIAGHRVPAEDDVEDLLTALGGRADIRAIELASTRIRVNVADPSLVDQQAVGLLGLRGIAMPTAHWVHLLIGSAAEATARNSAARPLFRAAEGVGCRLAGDRNCCMERQAWSSAAITSRSAPTAAGPENWSWRLPAGDAVAVPSTLVVRDEVSVVDLVVVDCQTPFTLTNWFSGGSPPSTCRLCSSSHHAEGACTHTRCLAVVGDIDHRLELHVIVQVTLVHARLAVQIQAAPDAGAADVRPRSAISMLPSAANRLASRSHWSVAG